jgi:hypothetical protein
MPMQAPGASAMAQAPQQQQFAQASPQGGGMPSMFGGGSSGGGGDMMGGLMGLVMGPRTRALMQAQQEKQQEQQQKQQVANVTYKTLRTKYNLDHDTAVAAVLNPTLLANVLKGQDEGKTGDIKEYEYAKKHDGFKGTLSDWRAHGRAGAGELGLQPIWGIDENGEPAIMQLGKSGTAAKAVTPPGFKIQSKAIEIKSPQGTYLQDPQTRQIVGFVPNDHKGTEAAKAEGEVEGKARGGLHGVKTTVENAFVTINKLRNHPGIDVGTGASNKWDPRSWTPGTDAYNFNELNKQAQGQAFMAAREGLKGAGQVTDFEGERGERAIANLNAAQSKEQYLAALDTLEKMMRASYEDLRKKAGGKGEPLSAPGSVGTSRIRIDADGKIIE